MGRARALLLDRDGVINVDHGYVGTPDRFQFVEGILPLARAAADAGWRVVVATNQSGLARGYYAEADFQAITRHMRAGFAAHGAELAAVLHCPFHPEGRVAGLARESYWRKPNPGMILEAARRLGLDLARSVFIGDAATDMTAARAAGVGVRLLLSQDPDARADDASGVIARLADANPFLAAPRPARMPSPPFPPRPRRQTA